MPAKSQLTLTGMCLPMYLSAMPLACISCAIWSDVTSVDIPVQWSEDWTSVSVVNNVLVTDPTI